MAFSQETYCDAIIIYVILSLHALVNLANVVNGATTWFIGERSERSEPQIWPGSLVNVANLVNASEHYLVLDMNEVLLIQRINSVTPQLDKLSMRPQKQTNTCTEPESVDICFDDTSYCLNYNTLVHGSHRILLNNSDPLLWCMLGVSTVNGSTKPVCCVRQVHQ